MMIEESIILYQTKSRTEIKDRIESVSEGFNHFEVNLSSSERLKTIDVELASLRENFDKSFEEDSNQVGKRT